MAAASLHLCLLHQSPIQDRPIFRSRRPPVRCAADRQALFSRIAPVYDNLNDMLSLGQHRIWKRMAVSWSGAQEGDNVLDLCCGSGDLAFLLSEKVGSNGKVIGLDFSEEQLSVASSRQHLRSKACYNNIMWVEGNALDLPYPNCYFNAITIGYGLRNVVDFRKAMEEMFRVLKPGSRVSVLDFNKSTNTLIASVQEWMIDNVVVPTATVYGVTEEYKYLKSSIHGFLTGKELEMLALESGFSNAKHYEISGGLMGNLVATRRPTFLMVKNFQFRNLLLMFLSQINQLGKFQGKLPLPGQQKSMFIWKPYIPKKICATVALYYLSLVASPVQEQSRQPTTMQS